MSRVASARRERTRTAPHDSRQVGNYVLSKTLGEGTFGKVKLGVHSLTGEQVAVKVLEKDRIVDKGDIQRVTREIQILKHVRHPNVVRLLEVIEKPRHIYLVTEFLAGGELFDFIVAHNRLHESQACHIFRQIILGVDACHAMGVAHRDLKPENILIDEGCQIKMIDFGLSSMFNGPDVQLRTACGSPCYAAPEMVAGKRYKGSQVDFWSLGVCLFAMLCGYLPFEDPDTSVLYSKIMAGEYAMPSFLSLQACELIRGLLTTDPSKRFTIKDVYSNQWFVTRSAEPLKPPLSLHPETMDSVNAMEVDETILAQVEAIGISRDYCVDSLSARKLNNATATYSLLQQRADRAAAMEAAMLDEAAAVAADLPAEDPSESAEEMESPRRYQTETVERRRGGGGGGDDQTSLSAHAADDAEAGMEAGACEGRGPPAQADAEAERTAWAMRAAEHEEARWPSAVGPDSRSESFRDPAEGAQADRRADRQAQRPPVAPRGRRSPAATLDADGGFAVYGRSQAPPPHAPPPAHWSPRPPPTPRSRVPGAGRPAPRVRDLVLYANVGVAVADGATWPGAPWDDSPLTSAEGWSVSARSTRPGSGASPRQRGRPGTAVPVGTRGGVGHGTRRPQPARPRSAAAGRPNTDPLRGRRTAAAENARYVEWTALGGQWRVPAHSLPARPAFAYGPPHDVRHETVSCWASLAGAKLRGHTLEVGGATEARVGQAVGAPYANSLEAVYGAQPTTPRKQRPSTGYRRASGGAVGATHWHTGHNGAPTMTHPSGRPPTELMAEALRAVEAAGASATPRSTFVIQCERGGVGFDLEVASIDATQTKFVVRLQQSAGDKWQFKQLCNSVLPTVRLTG